MLSTPASEKRFALNLKRWTSLPTFIGAVAIALSICLIGATPVRPGAADINDFAAYWSAASLVVHGKNPYAADLVLSLERGLKFTGSTPLIMRNPPWIVPIIAPLGFLSFVVAQRLWLVVGLFAVLISTKWLWDLYRVEGRSGVVTYLAVATFLPIPVAIAIGQVSPLVLLGIAGFLHFERKQKLGRAGVFLFLAALKPHLIFLVWIALALLSIYHRTVRIVGALVLTIALTSFIAISIDHSVFAQYFHMLLKERVPQELTPTISGLIRLWGGFYAAQFLPGILALAWVFFYIRRRCGGWNWTEELPMLAVVSLLTTPYGWFFDQVLLLPCMFQGIIKLRAARYGRLTLGIAALYLGTNMLVLVLILFHRPGFWYTWTIPFWFVLFIIASLRQDRRSQERSMSQGKILPS